MVEHGYMIITGGGDGIMGAAQKGAGAENSFGLNIRLPFEQRANEMIHGDPKLINFNYFFTRKLNFVKEAHAIALFPGGFGTMDEGFEVLTLMQTGKARIFPIVLVDKPGGTYWETWVRVPAGSPARPGPHLAGRLQSLPHRSDVDAAVEEIVQFYTNYRSYRWVGNRMVIRIKQRLTECCDREAEYRLPRHDRKWNTRCRELRFPEEANEPDIAGYPRLILQPHRRNFGRRTPAPYCG